MANFRTFGTIAVMIACFAVIYPRFMHPIVLKMFGLNDPLPNKDDDTKFPPGYKSGLHPDGKGGDRMPDDIKRHMRGGPHPGMRAAAEMHRQQAPQGSGRGMMGVVLPMYAIGIVLYLVYTLFKVFNKSKTNSWNRPGRNTYSDSGERQGQDRMGFPTDYTGAGDVHNFLHDQQQRKDLEELLTRVDDKNVSVEEMRLLQKRLEETEAQMTRILQAMQSVQTNVDHVASTAYTQQSQRKMTDSSPDMDSYEVVDTEEEDEGRREQQTTEQQNSGPIPAETRRWRESGENTENLESERDKEPEGSETAESAQAADSTGPQKQESDGDELGSEEENESRDTDMDSGQADEEDCDAAYDVIATPVTDTHDVEEEEKDSENSVRRRAGKNED